MSQLAASGVGLLLALSVLGIFAARRALGTRLVYAACAAVCAALAGVALLGLLAPGAGLESVEIPVGLPLGRTVLGLDPLSAAFAVIVNLAAAIVSGYAIGYGAHAREPLRVVPFYPAFIAGMNLVLLAQDAFSFLVGWELMSLASWALVLSEHRAAENRHAALVYLIMASGGALTLLLAFGLLAGPHGGYSFEAIRRVSSAGVGPIVLLLALLGAGSKAGLVPLHAWLPLAHPAAPSHVSALMSAVMTKVAVYGFVRLVFDLAGPPAWWWSVPVLLIAAVTALLGVLYALMEHDLKRLLAYHTVENIGIIFIGLGLALAFEASGMRAAAALAFAAAIFHVFNHSLFKSLLFMGSGAVLNATGERDMEHLGGLIKAMPVTAVAFLAGCIAISALPPFNGFVSEWLTFQAILLSPQLPQWVARLLVPAVGATLACSAALAAACFVKAFGMSFLGRPRTKAASAAAETDRFSQIAMLLLALLCLLAGILPGFVLDSLGAVTQLAVGERLAPQSAQAWMRIVPVDIHRSAYSGLFVFVMILLAAAATAFVVRRVASHALRRSPAWDCGFPDASPATQYTAGSFAQPIRRVFGSVVFRAREAVAMPKPGDTAVARLQVELHDTVWDALYAPIIRLVAATAERLNRMQFLTIRNYLTLVFAALVALLIIVGTWR
ncbi:MAG: hydrogenase 4 subunit B [Gammaproteobacteria bacterium]|nr:MAG: hydrogenase 4 subunit B [Gammaproteobacteria bacterium]TLZ38287.1 MAG: hydrogenase 4 subunit B [Gammaproteobacteria bacterium]